jgi:heterodisulfide reductase subunit B
MMKKIPYYPGCSLQTKAKHFETSAMAVAEALDYELVTLPRWNCCGAVHSLTTDDLMHHVAPVTTLLRSKEFSAENHLDDSRLVVLCAMCLNVLKRTNKRVQELLEDRTKINDFMYLENSKYDGTTTVIHFLELLREIGWDTIKQKVKSPLSTLAVSPYYGCLLLRPKEVGIDNPEAPKIQEDLLHSLGATVIENPLKNRCCGSYHTLMDKDVVAELSYDILINAQKAGAEIITTSCPLCAFNLDQRQEDILKKHPDFTKIPVVYFTELMMIAFDLPLEKAGLDMHYVDPRPLLLKKEMLHD